MTGSFIASTLIGVSATALIAVAAARLARSARAAVRHAILAAAFATAVLLPLVAVVVPTVSVTVPIFRVDTPEQIGPAAYDVVDGDTPAVTAAPQPASTVAVAEESRRPVRAWGLVGIWAIGAVLSLIPVASGLREMRRLRRTAQPWRQGEVIARARARDGRRRSAVGVFVHPAIASPATCGVRRPAVLFPMDATQWPADELQRALVHELEHVRRRDWLTQCLARIVCAAYWFHPLLWMARRDLLLDAERACDDAVLAQLAALDGSEAAYADQLVSLARRVSAGMRHPMLAMADRRDLAARVRALLDKGQPRGRASASVVTVVCALAAALVVAVAALRITVRAQGDPVLSAETPRFDAASIRPCESAAPAPVGRAGGAGQAVSSPGRLHIDCAPLLGSDGLIRMAYAKFANGQVNRYWAFLPITGRGPAWATSDRFTIDASAGGAPSVQMMKGPMLQALLADAFQLRTHREARTVPIYTLTVAPGGSKLHPFDGRCKPIDFTKDIPTQLEADGACVFVGAKDRWDAPGQTVDDFIKTALSDLDRPVVNRTGLSGRFDFALDLSAGDGGDYAASIAQAMRRQLGLVLAPSNGPEDFLVMDSVEKPPVSWVKRQTSVPQKFEAVSIRPCADDTPPVGANGGARSSQGGFPTISPGRFTIDCGTVERLISNAYVLNGERLQNNIARIGDVSWWTGGPEWIRYDKFTIEASAPGVTDRAVLLGPMLRALLEDRFRLKLHRETKDMPMYALTIAKGGLKIQPMPPDGCVDPNRLGAGGQIDAAAVRANAEAVNAGTAKPTCSGMTMMGGPGHARWTIGGTTVPNFAGILTTSMDHFVIDRTGLDPETKYNIHLEFAPDEHVPGADKRNPRTTFDPPDAPTIFAALEQQLGMKLDATKGPQGYLVIDHVERPAPDGPIVVPARARGPGR